MRKLRGHSEKDRENSSSRDKILLQHEVCRVDLKNFLLELANTEQGPAGSQLSTSLVRGSTLFQLLGLPALVPG